MTQEIKEEKENSPAENSAEEVKPKKGSFGIYLLKCLFLALFAGALGGFAYLQFFTEKPLFPFPGIKEKKVEHFTLADDNRGHDLQGKNTYSASLYFISSDMQNLERVDRELAFGANNLENARNIIDNLLRGPDDEALISPFSKDVKIRTVFLYKDVLYVDFSRSIMKLKNTSALRESFMIESIIKSLAASVSDIKKLKFLVNGKSMPTFFKAEGHIDISDMFSVN